MNGGDRVDLIQCRIAIEKEIERVKEVDVAACIAALEEAYSRLTALIDHREKVRDEILVTWKRLIIFFLQSRLPALFIAWPADSLHIVRDYRRRATISPIVC